AGVRVGGRRIELVREVDRGRRALGSRAVVAEAGGRVDVGDRDDGLRLAEAAVVVHALALVVFGRGPDVEGAAGRGRGAGAGVGGAGDAVSLHDALPI